MEECHLCAEALLICEKHRAIFSPLDVELNDALDQIALTPPLRGPEDRRWVGPLCAHCGKKGHLGIDCALDPWGKNWKNRR